MGDGTSMCVPLPCNDICMLLLLLLDDGDDDKDDDVLVSLPGGR